MAELSKKSLESRARDHLLKSLRGGRWRDGLPTERELAVSLGVSRPILRMALKSLEDRGYLERVKRRRVPTSKVGETPQKRSALIVHSSIEATMPASTATMIRIMTELLHEKQVDVKSVICLGLKTSSPEQELAKLHNEFPNEVWVLRSPSVSALEWCEKHHPECVVIGAQPAESSFSGVDLDVGKMFSHSLQLCQEHNKKQVVFIVPPGASHAASKLASFLDSFSAEGVDTSVAKVAMSDAKEARRKMMHLLSAKPCPNAFICTNFQQWLLVYSVLVEAKISPLTDVFLLCHYSDPLMQCVSHGVPHYSFDWTLAAQHLADRVEEVREEKRATVLMLAPKYEDLGGYAS